MQLLLQEVRSCEPDLIFPGNLKMVQIESYFRVKCWIKVGTGWRTTEIFPEEAEANLNCNED